MKKLILSSLAATAILALSNCAHHQQATQQQTTMETRSGK